MAVNDKPLVSIDFNRNPARMQVIDGKLVRVMSRGDNEWVFSNRMSDTAVAMGKLI